MLSVAVGMGAMAWAAEPVARFVFDTPGPAGLPDGWELKDKEGKPVTYFENGGEVKAICLKSNSSSFSIQKKVKINAAASPFVVWRWLVKELPAGGDSRNGDKDDQAGQLMVAFANRKTISYVWDTTAPVGATSDFSIPFVMKVKTLVVKSGPEDLGKWVAMSRNVYQDYKTLFGGEPPEIEGIRYQINSQHTKTSAESCLT